MSERAPAVLSDIVYESIHRQIVTGHYRPNQRLVETAIAAELGASRTPVREALFRLVKDGLAEKTAHGLAVREFTVSQIREIYEVRAALEGCAAGLAARRASEAELATIEEKHRRLAHTRDGVAVDRFELVETNADFHAAVIAAGGNTRLRTFATTNLAYFFNTEVAALTGEQSLVNSIAEHERIMSAIRCRDAEGAEREARAHVMSGLRMIEDYHRVSAS